MAGRRGGVRVYRPVNRGKTSHHWWADFSTPDGQRIRRNTRCTEYAAALRIATEWFRAAQHHAAETAAGIERPSDVTMLALADDFIDAMRGERAPRYVLTVEDHLRAYVLPYFGLETKAASLTRPAVEGFRRAVLSGAIVTKAARSRRSGLPSAATCNRIMVALRRLLDFGVRLGLLRDNPAKSLPALRERPEARHRALSDVEIEALLAGLAAGRTRRTMHTRWIRFMIATGIRDDEADTAEWIDVDWTRRCLAIPATRAKGARARNVPLTAEALVVLGEIKQECGAIGLIFGPHDRRTALARAWARARAELEKRGIEVPARTPSAHDFRHTCASRAAAAGLDLAEMMAWFGWRSPQVASRYIHMYGGRWERMAAKMDSIR